MCRSDTSNTHTHVHKYCSALLGNKRNELNPNRVVVAATATISVSIKRAPHNHSQVSRDRPSDIHIPARKSLPARWATQWRPRATNRRCTTWTAYWMKRRSAAISTRISGAISQFRVPVASDRRTGNATRLMENSSIAAVPAERRTTRCVTLFRTLSF